MRALLRQRLPFVITSYNLTEAETDEEALDEIGCAFLWRPEPNPWASLFPEVGGVR